MCVRWRAELAVELALELGGGLWGQEVNDDMSIEKRRDSSGLVL